MTDHPIDPEYPGGPDAPRPRVTIRVEEALAAAAMALICIISFGNVVVRYATNISFAFTEEFSVALMVFMTFVGSSLAFAVDGHIRIGFVADRLPAPWPRVLAMVAIAASLLMLGLVAWYGGRLSWDEWRFEETSPGLGHPTWIYTVWMPLLAIVCMMRLCGRMWALLRGRP